MPFFTVVLLARQTMRTTVRVEAGNEAEAKDKALEAGREDPQVHWKRDGGRYSWVHEIHPN
jgi:hypothetical protein